jgi:hypothetical protein
MVATTEVHIFIGEGDKKIDRLPPRREKVSSRAFY